MATMGVTHQVTVKGDQTYIHGLLLTSLTPVLGRSYGYRITADTGTSVAWTRRYTPTWAIVLAIIGALIFLLGLLFLLVKDEDVLVASLQPYGDSTVVTFTGAGPPKIMEGLNWFQASTQQIAQGWYDDPEAPGQQRYWNGSEWTEQRRPPPSTGGVSG